MRDIYGNTMPASVWHASTATSLPEMMAPASALGEWWHVIDHETYLDPPTSDDPDLRSEIDAETRTAYGNAVYEAFMTSDDPELRSLADGAGLHGLGDEVAILFVSGDPVYVERYGEAVEIDLTSPSILAMIPDDNLTEDRLSWLLVLKVGAPFPAMQASHHLP